MSVFDSVACNLDASVVIATRNRPDDLARCLAALGRQTSRRSFEVIVVDDGSDPPIRLPERAATRLLHTGGLGPAMARNRGVDEARGAVVLFTDDDTEPDSGWVEAACEYLSNHPDCIGVEGPTLSPPFDYLFEHSIENANAGAYWTCNVAYRRETLESVGGFSEAFPWPHCEDLDLGFRAAHFGPIGFISDMRVVHRPRPQSTVQLITRGRLARSELVLFSRHPGRYPARFGLGWRALALAGILHRWARHLGDEGVRLLLSPRRMLRFVAVAVGEIGLATYTVVAVRGSRRRGKR